MWQGLSSWRSDRKDQRPEESGRGTQGCARYRFPCDFQARLWRLKRVLDRLRLSYNQKYWSGA
jgi:hypothetical protein